MAKAFNLTKKTGAKMLKDLIDAFNADKVTVDFIFMPYDFRTIEATVTGFEYLTPDTLSVCIRLDTNRLKGGYWFDYDISLKFSAEDVLRSWSCKNDRLWVVISQTDGDTLLGFKNI